MIAGFKRKEMAVFAAVQNTGKSVWADMVNQLTQPNIKLIDSAEVDGKPWYTVQLNLPAQQWLRDQPVDDWYEHIDQRYYINRSVFDVSDKLYTALQLKWS